MTDLQIPAFLYRPRTAESIALANRIIAEEHGAVRVWKMPSKEPKVRERMPIYCDNPNLEVVVNVSIGNGVKAIARYLDWAEFQEEHNFQLYPFKRAATVGDETLVLVGGNLWVPKSADEKPPSAPVRASDTRDKIWAWCDKAWAAAGSPKDVAVVLKLRRAWYALMEKDGIKKATASSESGQWMKARLG